MTERTPVTATPAAPAVPAAEAALEGPGRPDRRRRLVFIVTAMGAFMASLDLSIVNVAFPALERSFPHDPAATLAWVITGYSIVFGALLVIAGRTADRLGSRRIFMVGLGVFCLGSLLCGLAPSVALLVTGRLVQGAGAAAVLPSSLGLLLAAFPVERRSQIVALWGGIGALAVATGPSLGAALITGFGWRAAFYVNLPVGLVAFVLGRRVLAESRRADAPSSPDYPGVVLLGVGLAALVLAISEGPTWGWSSARIVTALVGAVVLVALFVRRSARHPEPVLDLALFRERSFTVANAATLLYAMGFFAMLLGNILFLTSVWHYSILTAGLAVTPGPLVVAIVAGPAGRLAARYGFRPVLLVGFVVFASGLAWYALHVGVARDYLAIWLPGTLVVGLGIGLTFPVLSAAAVSSLHPERFSVGSAVNQTARQVGGALGVAVLVVIVGGPRSAGAALTAFHHLWWYAAGMAALSGVMSALLPPARVAAVATADDTTVSPPTELRVVPPPVDTRPAPWAPLEEPA
jgi:EmrB/QacA subfamily drug resistance transporter